MISNILLLMAAASLVILRKPFSKFLIEFQNKNFGYKMGPREIKGTEAGCIVIAVGIAIMAIVRLASSSGI